LHRHGGEFCNPPRAIEPLEHLYLRKKCPKTLPAGEHSFVALSPSQLDLTAFYKDEERDVVYMRFYNASSSPCEGRIEINLGKVSRKATLVDLNGVALADQQGLRHAGGKISLNVRPAQIVSIALAFAGNR
jgi:hypothetical protein